MPVSRRNGPTQKELPGRIRELEEKLRGCERDKQEFSLRIQKLARQVASENEWLRALARDAETRPDIIPPAQPPKYASGDLISQTPTTLHRVEKSVPMSAHSGNLGPAFHRNIAASQDTQRPTTNIKARLTTPSQQPAPKPCPCKKELPKRAIPPSLRYSYDLDAGEPEHRNTVTCQKALDIIEAADCGSELDDLRETLGCTSQCCPDLDTCEIESGLLMMILDNTI